MLGQTLYKIIPILLVFLISFAQALADAPKRQRTKWCETLFGRDHYQRMLDKPLAPGSELPIGYWTDERIDIVIRALYQRSIPLAPKYLTTAVFEETSAVIKSALKQPAATPSNFVNAVTKRGGFRKAAARQHIHFQSMQFPEGSQFTFAALIKGVRVLIANEVSVRADDILMYQPSPLIQEKLRPIFGVDVSGARLWALAYYFRGENKWQEVVRIAKSTKPLSDFEEAPKDIVRKAFETMEPREQDVIRVIMDIVDMSDGLLTPGDVHRCLPPSMQKELTLSETANYLETVQDVLSLTR